jgi:tetratricopeptide (TPR) repeat protein
MTTENNLSASRKYVPATLPWVIAAAAFLVYIISLNWWVSLNSLGPVARVCGWLWRPALTQPLTCAVLYPFSWLSESWIPLALNVFAALCAVLVLALLARSVSLLPHDLTPEEPLRKINEASLLLVPNAWVPPALAAVVCGLQLSFWEHATSFTGEMIDLLVFAYVIRCLLEFRVDQKQFWLSRAAFVYAAGMANNWAMIGYFPVFLAAIFRLKGFGMVYDARFLFRMTLWGLAGLSLYLLLPALHSLSIRPQLGFWPALRVNLGSQKSMLSSLQVPAFKALAVASLLPLLVLSIRWKSHTVQISDDSRLGVFLTKATGHFVHALFFLTALWLALDPVFSPRNLALGTAMLTCYYLSALVAGYCAGYFLLFGDATAGAQKRPFKLPVALVYVLLIALPLALAWRNLGQIRFTNGPAVRHFTQQLYSDLPAGKSVVLSDDSVQLLLLRAELGAHHGANDALLLDAPSLASAEYHRFMAEHFKSRWPVAAPTNRLDLVGPRQLLDLISRFADREPIVYLHPSFGYLFERFLERPHGLVHYLEPVPMAPVSDEDRGSPILSDPLAVTNEQLWQTRWNQTLQTLAEHTRTNPNHAARGSAAFLLLAAEPNITATFLGAAYSKSLDYWGVALQRLGRWPAAGLWFQRAIELNPHNLAARINLEYNQRCQHGDKSRLDPSLMQRQFHESFGRYDGWLEVLDKDGPIDEPSYLSNVARALLDVKNNRQAARELARCADLAPDWLEPKLWLALGYLDLRDFAAALQVTDSIPASPEVPDGTGLPELVFCRTTALRALGRTNDANASLESFIQLHPEPSPLLLKAADLFMKNKQMAGAVRLLEALVQREPDNVGLLSKKGAAELELSRFHDAITTLSRVLSLDSSDTQARLNRAVARLASGQLEAARDDYQELLNAPATSQKALFGLGGIAWRKRDTNSAIQFYEQYLATGKPESVQYSIASRRLKQLKGKMAQLPGSEPKELPVN